MRITIITVLLLAASSVFAQGSATGKITGRVVNESGQPLPNVSITVQAANSFQFSEGTLTDREGKFQITGLEPRSYRVFASLRTYTSVDGDAVWSRNYRVGDSVNLVLTKGGVITGTVTTATGEPVVGVRVYVRMINGEESRSTRPVFRFQAIRTTDDRGVYRIYGLATGTYVVWAGGLGGVNQGLDAFDSDVATYSPSSSRDTAAEISVRAGQETTNINITYRGQPGRIISGSAKWETGEKTAFGINLTAVGKGRSEWSMFTVQDSNSKGFELRGVEDGDYDITALSLLPNGQSGLISKRIKVRGVDVTGIELVTQPLASVSGRFVLEESKATECAGKQRPLFGETLVSASQDESQVVQYHPQFHWLLGLPTGADAQWNLTIRNLVAGRYFFVPQFEEKYWYLQSITLTPPAGAKTAATDAARTWTTVKPGDRISGLTITLAQGAASLHGQLALKEGETPPDGGVGYLVPAEREKALDVLRYFTGAISSDGKIALSNIAPGRYWLLVKTETTVSSLTKLRSPDQAEFRAKLRREAEAANTPIEFTPCQNVTGFQIPAH